MAVAGAAGPGGGPHRDVHRGAVGRLDVQAPALQAHRRPLATLAVHVRRVKGVRPTFLETLDAPPILARVDALKARARELEQGVELKLSVAFDTLFGGFRQRAQRTFELLQRYPWRGNVRELQHAVERAVILTTADVLQPSAFDAERFGFVKRYSWEPWHFELSGSRG